MVQHTSIFECSSCGATHNTSSTALPVGWSAAHGSAWCNDCTAAGIPARTIKPARKAKAASKAKAGRKALAA